MTTASFGKHSVRGVCAENYKKNHLLIGVLKYEAKFYCLVFPEVFFTQQDFRPLSPRLQLIENKSLQTLKTNNLIKY